MNVFKKYVPVVMYDDTGNGIDILNSETLIKKQIKDWGYITTWEKAKKISKQKNKGFFIYDDTPKEIIEYINN